VPRSSRSRTSVGVIASNREALNRVADPHVHAVDADERVVMPGHDVVDRQRASVPEVGLGVKHPSPPGPRVSRGVAARRPADGRCSAAGRMGWSPRGCAGRALARVARRRCRRRTEAAGPAAAAVPAGIAPAATQPARCRSPTAARVAARRCRAPAAARPLRSPRPSHSPRPTAPPAATASSAPSRIPVPSRAGAAARSGPRVGHPSGRPAPPARRRALRRASWMRLIGRRLSSARMPRRTCFQPRWSQPST